VSRFRCATILCTTAFVAAVASAGGGNRDSGRLALAPSGISAAARRPAGAPLELSQALARRLDEGIPVAQKRLRDFASCRALFTRLGSDGAAEVAGASYRPASAEQERRYCRRGVEALTNVGGAAVALCRSFAHLSSQQAAIILIHEALHLAGQTEYPQAARAPDSRALTEMVMSSCQLF
jgi:hypothetical protein